MPSPTDVAARETSQRLTSLFQQAPVGFAVFRGSRYIIEEANRTVCRLWGRTQEQVLGKPLFEALPEAAGQGFEQLLDGVLATGVAFVGKELPARLARMDGGGIEDVYFNFVYEPLRSAEGKVEGVIVVATEATDEVRARQAQAAATAAKERQSEQRLTFALEAGGLGHWQYDVKTGRLDVSDGFKVNLGLEPAAPLPSLEDLRALVHPDDRAGVDAAIERALRGCGNYEAEYRVIAPRGKLCWVLSRGRVACDPHGVPISMTGINFNTTARKEAEIEREDLLGEIEAARNRLESLFEHAPAFVCTLRGPDHVVEMANPLYQRMVGPGRRLAGLPLGEALPEAIEQGFVALLDKVYRTGDPYVGREVFLRLDRGEGRMPEDAFVTFVYQATRNRQGEIDGIDVFGFEVTNQVRARLQAETLAGELRRRADFEQYLIGIVSHDLRNPLGNILLGISALLRGEELTDRQTKNIVRIHNAAERANTMIRDLLDFTQARLGGGLRVQRRGVDLQEVFRSVIEEVEATHASREVQTSLEGELRGEFDPDRLGQLMQNLLSNALTYSPEGTPVRIEARQEEDAVSLSVHNQGNPIPTAQLENIFQPLRRATSALDKGSRSIGLGLYIVKEVVDAHGGTIAVQSTAERGTTFTVRLPSRMPG